MKAKTIAKAIPLVIPCLTGLAIYALGARPGSAVLHPSPVARPHSSVPVAPLFAPSVLAWEEEIVDWSEGFGLDPNLVAAVMQIESCGNPRAVSRAGAQGLFQVMPFHFTDGEAMQDPETNARRGLTYLAESLRLSGGKVGLALAGYNGGHGVIRWDPAQWPAETMRYAYWGEGIYADAAAGRASSPRLEEWLAAGGAWLCEKATIEMGG
jgi:soluble lytic murein transglycosylase-like protein